MQKINNFFSIFCGTNNSTAAMFGYSVFGISIKTLFMALAFFGLSAMAVNAQNRIYFKPTVDWCNDAADFSAFLINTSTSDVVLVQFQAVAGQTHVYSATLTSTNYDKIRFYRHPAGEVLGTQDWGWNCTGQMPFNYVPDIFYTMNQTFGLRLTIHKAQMTFSTLR